MQEADAASANNAWSQILGWQLDRGLGGTPAILCGERCVSYAELTAQVDRIGQALRRAGIDRGQRVLLLTKDSPAMVAAYLAVMKIGAVVIALNTRGSPSDLAHAFTDSEARALLLDAEFRPLFEAGRGLAAHVPPLVVDDIEAFAGGHDAPLAAAPVRPGDMAFWVYTSGTTGKPKAAIHCHGDVAIAHRHLAENLGVVPGDRVFASSKLFFAFALGHVLIAGLKCGATLILHEGWPDAAGIAQVVERHRPQVMFGVPTLYRNLLLEGVAGSPGFRAVRHFVSAGERLPEDLLLRWQAASGAPILEGVGASETIFLMIANTPTAWRPGSTGRAMPWAELRLEGEDGRAVTAPGESGVLWVRMASVAAGYWNQPEKTAQCFRDGWYRTGDLFCCDAEGWWTHGGRADDMLKISGQWVGPAEIEERALEVPGVLEAAVVGLPNADGLVRLALVLVADPTVGEGPLTTAVQEHLKRHLAIYKCPRRIVFLEAMPRTATGKLQRFQLRQMLDAAGAGQGGGQPG